MAAWAGCTDPNDSPELRPLGFEPELEGPSRGRPPAPSALTERPVLGAGSVRLREWRWQQFQPGPPLTAEIGRPDVVLRRDPRGNRAALLGREPSRLSRPALPTSSAGPPTRPRPFADPGPGVLGDQARTLIRDQESVSEGRARRVQRGSAVNGGSTASPRSHPRSWPYRCPSDLPGPSRSSSAPSSRISSP